MSEPLDIKRMADALGGVICRGQILAPGPGHSPADRSMSVLVEAHAPDGFVVNSFAGDSPLECRDYIRAKCGLDAWRPGSSRPALSPAPQRRAEPDHHANPDALAIWRGGHRGAEVVPAYLQRRWITLPPPPTIRQGTTLIFGRTPVPTMIAAVQAPRGHIIAVQETRLTWLGVKAPVSVPRITTGVLGYGAVRLAAAGEILGLAEGVETALSAMQMHDLPVWATLGGQRMSRIALPSCVRQVRLFGDNDSAGQTSVEMAADHYRGLGLSVTTAFPPGGYGDWNDALAAREVAA